MLLKNEPPDYLFWRKTIFSGWKYIQKIRRFLILVFVVGGFLVSYILGVFSTKLGSTSDVLKPLFLENIKVPLNFLRGLFADVKTIYIDISFVNYQKLEKKRDIALKTGQLDSKDDDFVNAKLRYNDKTYNIELRLKGDLSDHWQGDRWSFRVKIKGNETWRGMKKISLQHPKTRNYIYEWIYHEALKREGIAALRYDFVKVILNGKTLGIYALEEHFDKLTIESNARRTGAIVRFDENLFFDTYFGARYSSNRIPDAANRLFDEYIMSAPILDYDKKNTPASEMIQAKALLNEFRNGALAVHKLIDVDKLATFYAISDLMDGSHALGWPNLRFYYNPITSKLEPIAFDKGRGFYIQTIHYLENRDSYISKEHHRRIFSNPILLEKYLSELYRISEKEYLDRLLKDLNAELQKKLSILYKDFPYFHYTTKYLYANQAFIKQLLNPLNGLLAYERGIDDNHLILEVANIQALPVEISHLLYKGSLKLTPKTRIILDPKKEAQPLEFHNFTFYPQEHPKATLDKNIDHFKLAYKMLGGKEEKIAPISPQRQEALVDVSSDLLRQDPNSHTVPFMTMNDSKKEILIRQGSWNLNHPLIIPPGYTVYCFPGTKIDLRKRAKIISYSPLYFLGSVQEPISIHSSDFTGEGLVVLKAREKSILKHLVFHGLNAPSEKNWILTGAITFYESPVEIYHTKFLNNKKGDDYLNIFRSEFKIHSSLFSNILSDAVDGDFTKGEIIDTMFTNIGGDALDFSGSVIELDRLFMSHIRDKGISAGENSLVQARHIEIESSKIGIASKDLSRVSLFDSSIKNSEIGIAVFRKKPEFGPASMECNKLTINNVVRNHLVENDSSLTLNGKEIPLNEKQSNIKKLLYANE